jgi:hypothetical protein
MLRERQTLDRSSKTWDRIFIENGEKISKATRTINHKIRKNLGAYVAVRATNKVLKSTASS